jgi:hypothetical protein
MLLLSAERSGLSLPASAEVPLSGRRRHRPAPSLAVQMPAVPFGFGARAARGLSFAGRIRLFERL